jgi:hypothetical protein
MKNGLIVDEDGTKFHYLNDKLHRDENLPAIEWAWGTKWYYVNGKFHRENGHAVEYSNGDKDYYLFGDWFSEQDYWKEIKKRKSLNYIIKNYLKTTTFSWRKAAQELLPNELVRVQPMKIPRLAFLEYTYDNNAAIDSLTKDSSAINETENVNICSGK